MTTLESRAITAANTSFSNTPNKWEWCQPAFESTFISLHLLRLQFSKWLINLKLLEKCAKKAELQECILMRSSTNLCLSMAHYRFIFKKENSCLHGADVEIVREVQVLTMHQVSHKQNCCWCSRAGNLVHMSSLAKLLLMWRSRVLSH